MLEPQQIKNPSTNLIVNSSKEELIWLNGYVTGILAHPEKQEGQPIGKTVTNKITIAYGTETGNSKKSGS